SPRSWRYASGAVVWQCGSGKIHHPGETRPEFAGDVSYPGTYAEDRQDELIRLLIAPARLRPQHRFVIAGAQYLQEFPWTSNIWFVRHLPPSLHGSFYSSSRMTLNVTRRAMAKSGYCPSGRLFEAAACGVPVLTDVWEGLDHFYKPGEEMIFCRST